MNFTTNKYILILFLQLMGNMDLGVLSLFAPRHVVGEFRSGRESVTTPPPVEGGKTVWGHLRKQKDARMICAQVYTMLSRNLESFLCSSGGSLEF